MLYGLLRSGRTTRASVLLSLGLALLGLLAMYLSFFRAFPGQSPRVAADRSTSSIPTAGRISTPQSPLSAANPYEDMDSGQMEPGFHRVLVVAKLASEDTSWIQSELSDMMEPHGPLTTAIYTVDDPDARLRVPVNRGHEAMVYLTYIIDHYEQLPEVAIFIHSHADAWHNNDLLNGSSAQMVRLLSSEKVVREGYMNLRCHWEPGCPNWIHPLSTHRDDHKKEEPVFSTAFQELFPGDPVPEVLSQPCCAQFAVSRARILLHSRQKYIAWRKWITHTDLDSRTSGRIFEYVWQYMFATRAVHCPNTHICFCDAYSICFRDEHEYVVYTDVQDTYRAFRDELLDSRDVERAEWLRRVVHDLLAEMARRKQEAVDLGSNRSTKLEILTRAWAELLDHPPGHIAEKYGRFGTDTSISPV